MGGAVVQLVPEQQEAAHKEDGKDDRAPEPPVLPQLLPEALAHWGDRQPWEPWLPGRGSPRPYMAFLSRHADVFGTAHAWQLVLPLPAL